MHKKNKSKNKGKAISYILRENKAYKKALGGKVFSGYDWIYGVQCNSSHSNISSVFERTLNLQHNLFSPNSESANVRPTLEIVLYCILDVSDSIKNISLVNS